jgi:toluene monooxygenase system protein D
LSERKTHNKVGPVVRAGEIADAVIEAAHQDNPDKTVHVEDRTAYVRVELDGECIIRRETMEEMLGRPFQMRELETVLGSFAGQIETSSDQVRFFYNKKL